jgi:hypothetical protein
MEWRGGKREKEKNEKKKRNDLIDCKRKRLDFFFFCLRVNYNKLLIS